MKKTAIIAVIVAAIIAAACLVAVPSADAAPLKAGSACTRCESPSVSIPYIEDVTTSGKSFTAFIAVCGKDAKVKSAKVTVIDRKSGKRVHVDRLGVHTWAFRGKLNRDYKVTVKAKGAKAKSIGYRVY